MKEFVERFFVAQLGVELPAWAKILVALTNVILILVMAWALMGGAGRILRLLHRRMALDAGETEERKRIETLLRVFRYLASVVIGAVTIMLILAEIGISIAPILATAGVAGLAVGFGAQSLVKDYFTGFVMLLENQIRVGDSVEVAGKLGTVEEVTLRYVRLRDPEGFVHYVPNGVIATVTNRSREYAYALIEVGVSYQASLHQVFEVMQATGSEIRRDPAFGQSILEDLDIAGVQQWAESALVIRCRFKVRAHEQERVRREFLRRLKEAFDRAGIEIPVSPRAASAKL